METISVVLPDGSKRELESGATIATLATDIGRRLGAEAVAGVVNGTERDLDTELADGDDVEILTPTSEGGLHVLRHSTAHVLAQAVLELWPGATFAIGPPIEDGFYYDFELPAGPDGSHQTFSDEDLERIEAKMRDIVEADQPFVRSELAVDEAMKLMADHPYKQAIIERVTGGDIDDELAGEAGGADGGDIISFYRNTDAFIDMCVGPHVPSTGRLRHFKLMKVAGAYWRGDERNQMLQRVYGTAWSDAKALKAHLHRLEEAAKRDHRKLANELDLLSFPSELGAGLAVWHPKGPPFDA